MKIQDKIAIVTGASGGIGLALTEELAKRGAKVVLAARSKDKLEKVAAEIPGSLAVVADMTKPEDIKKLVAATKEKFGRVDILVNNAGVGLHAPIAQVDIEAYRQIMEVNVFGVLEAMQEVIPVMREQGEGVILNISSMVSKNYYPGLAAYASTKYALNALTLTARTELADEGIVVSVFHPRMTATDFGANSIGDKYDSTAGRPGMVVDTAEQVAVAAADLIESGAAEAGMGM
jgi:short-subunit dehydrogenase